MSSKKEKKETKHKNEPKEHKHVHTDQCSHEDEQRRMLESQIMQAHVAELEKQLNEVDTKLVELEFIKESLSQIKDQKGKDILLPLGSGVLVRGKLVDDEKVLVNVGAKLLVEKTLPEAEKIIDQQVAEIEEVRKLIEAEIQKYFNL